MTEKKTTTLLRGTKTVDMSPEAVDQRLREVSQLFKLGMSIREAKYLGTVEELKEEKPAADAENQSDDS